VTGMAREMVAARGARILDRLDIEPHRHAKPLADAIVPADSGPFRDRLLEGLSTLLLATSTRRPALATSAACHLVGVSPGATPLGDDYLAAGALTVATLGTEAGLPPETRRSWLEAVLPPRLAELTTDASRSMLADSVKGRIPEPVAPLLDLSTADCDLGGPLRRLKAMGATTGRGWTSAIGATALLLGATTEPRSAETPTEPEPTGGPTR